ncbi:hypothetical protein FACS1894163_01380 [Spirochaetia bacterium]|nr:hypothetical protein FACS1894163_01380 [Spirochaetia bacterium]
MPLPLILGIIGAATGVLGIGKGVKAAIDSKEAKNVNNNAEEIIRDAKALIEGARKRSSDGLTAMGKKKLFVLNNSVAVFIEYFSKIKNIELEDSVGMEELRQFAHDKQYFDELRTLSGYASSIAGGVAGGAVGGAITAFGAWGGAMALGTASTGAAISGLTGVAATNATLAFLGGGSLAAGGLGMAGGAAVLGGLIAGPALAVAGFIIGAKAKANLDNAYSNLAEANRICEELQAGADLCNGIRRRSTMFMRLLMRLDTVFMPLTYQLQAMVTDRLDQQNNLIREKWAELTTGEAALRRKHWFTWMFNHKKREAIQSEWYQGDEHVLPGTDFWALRKQQLSIQKAYRFNRKNRNYHLGETWSGWLAEQPLSKDVEFPMLTTEEKKMLAMTASMAKSIQMVLNTPILAEDGKLTPESEKLADEFKEKIPLLATAQVEQMEATKTLPRRETPLLPDIGKSVGQFEEDVGNDSSVA